MIDPDQATQRAVSLAHGQELQAVRAVTKAFGCTRSEARRAIRLFDATRRGAATPNPNAGNQIGNLFQPLPIQNKRSEVKIDPQPTVVRRAPDPILPPAVPADGGGGATVSCIVIGPGAVLGTADVHMDNFTPL